MREITARPVHDRPVDFFPGANSCQGFYSLFEHIGGGDPRATYVLKGGPGVGKSTFMKRAASVLSDEGYTVEYHWCASDSESLDAVHVPRLGASIIDGTSPHVVEPGDPGVTGFLINLGEHWDTDVLAASGEHIKYLKKRVDDHFRTAHARLGTAGACSRARDRMLVEQEAFDDAAVARDIRKITGEILSSREAAAEAYDNYEERHLFLSAITPQGGVSFARELARSADPCWVICDDTSILSHRLISEVLDGARAGSNPCWVFRCGLDPGKFEHCWLPSLNTALITVKSDGFHPEARCSHAVDLSDYLRDSRIKPLISTLGALRDTRQEALRDAVKDLGGARSTYQQLEEHYCTAMDFSGVDRAREKTLQALLDS